MIKGCQLFLTGAVLALLALGLMMVASASSRWDLRADQYEYFWRQLTWAGVGILGVVGLAMMNYRYLRPLAWPLFWVTVVVLSLCYVPVIGVAVNGEQRWIQVPFLGRIQPSEPAKLMVIVTLAAWYAQRKSEIRSFKNGFLYPGLIFALPLALIFFEKDMGTAVALGTAGVLVMFVAGVRLPYLLAAAGAGAAGLAAMVMLSPNRMRRILAFQDLEAHKEGAGWQQWLAQQAFGNGGLNGVGLGNGLVKQMNFPEHHTDFIFPVIGEELGMWVSLAVIGAFAVITIMGAAIALNASDLFGRLLGFGVTAIIVVPAMMNIGVTTALLPNTGLPLPFVSYGGSNLVFTLAMVGVLLSVHRKGRVIDYTALPPMKDKRYEPKL